MGRTYLWRVFATLLSVVALIASSAQAQSALQPYDIPAGDLGPAITAFATQNHLQISFPPKLVKNKKNHAVSGSYTPAQALKELLAGSSLEAVEINPSTFVLKAAATAAKAPAAAGATGAANTEGPVSADVSVQSQRPIQRFDPVANVDIPRTIDDVQPYYIFDSETIQDSGATNIEDFLKQRLTMDTVTQTNNQVYGPVGSVLGGGPLGNTSSINLRGLGTNETLILVDGHRRAGVTVQGTNEQPDINGIPLAAIDRIEVLPSSASAIYGASALGGVINIILKKNYKGGEVKYTYDNATSGSAPFSTLDGSYGFSAEGGKTHVMMTGHYADSSPLVLGDRRDLVENGVNTVRQNDPGAFNLSDIPFPGGSTPNIVSASYDANGNPLPLILKNGTALNSTFTHICPGISAATTLAALNSCLLANAGTYNYSLGAGTGVFGLQQPLNYSSRVLSGMLNIRRDMTSWLEAFVDLSVERNDGSSVYNPIAGTNLFVSSTAPTNPFQQAVEFTTPTSLAAPISADSTTRSATAGLTAHLPHEWVVEADYTWSQNQFSNLYSLVDNDALNGNPNRIPPETGAFPSGSINPFVDTIANPINYRPYLNPIGYGSSSTLESIALRATGAIFELPWGSPTIALGFEHRREGYPTSTLNDNYQTSTTADTYTTFFGQSQSTDSLYAETNIPLISKTNAIPGVRSLDLQFADRIERYSVNTGTTSEYVWPDFGSSYAYGYTGAYHCFTPAIDPACQDPLPASTSHYQSNNSTIGFRYRPLEAVTLRASLGTAFLPPTFSQLLPNPQVIPDGDTITDPKTGATYQVNITNGGNPDLQPEHDKNWDVGLIYQPVDGYLSGLRINLEYYDIVQKDPIVYVNGNEILRDPALASRVTRSPITGQITLINESFINAAEYQSDGWDLSANYALSTSFGTFEFVGAATLIEHERRQYNIGGPKYDFVGQVDGGGETKTKVTGTLTWHGHHWKAAWATRWFDGYEALTLAQGGGGAQGAARIPSQIYHDVLASYTFDQPRPSVLSDVTIQVGIKDLFNTAPPFDAYYAPFYVSPYGSILLREFRVSIRKGF